MRVASRHARFCNNVASMLDSRISTLVLAALVLAGCAGDLASPALRARPAANDSASACRPEVDASRPQFVLGYGSLMEHASRKRTSPRAGPAHPVELAGFRRGWFERGDSVGFSTTYLGVRPDAGSRMNAVVYAVEVEELAATDSRESSYCRTSIPLADIATRDDAFALPRDAQAWIYVTDPRRIAPPDARYPIVESYVDVFLSGCLEQQERFHLKDFARECIATTSGWSEHWVNDRIYPRRPFVHQPRAREIDLLLSQSLPSYFGRIRIEGGRN